MGTSLLAASVAGSDERIAAAATAQEPREQQHASHLAREADLRIALFELTVDRVGQFARDNHCPKVVNPDRVGQLPFLAVRRQTEVTV